MKLVKKNKKTESSAATSQLPPWKILIVDDEPDIHIVTQAAFQGLKFADKPLKIFQAMSGSEAREILIAEPDIAVAFIDVVMETDDAGLKLVDFIRNECQNQLIRLIIRTGQPGAAPEKDVVERYDIDDYKDKTELTAQKLYTTIRLALKSYQNLMTLNANRQGLQTIVDMAKDLYQPEQSVEQIYALFLNQMIDLYNSSNTSQAKPIDNAMIMLATVQNIEVQAATGKLTQTTPENESRIQICADAIRNNKLTDLPSDMTIIPFESGEDKRSFICLENAKHLGKMEQNLIHIMANQCTTAVKLAAAHQEITTLNEYLKADNIRMRAELEVARYLQKMVLPTDSELKKITNLEIVAFTEPADEVSGDYYDILQYHDHVICGIGDVTGHGLESGLLMLMAQTTVRCLLNNGIRDPSQFLSILNKIIYDYAQRMNIEKNLTLSFLDYQPIHSEQEMKGILRISGQHEEVLVARKGGKVEHLDTLDLGFPVGLEADIHNFVSQKEIHLQSDDVVVLYTDGITEAINTDKREYGLERFCEVLSCNWQRSAEEIKQAVIADLRQYIGQQQIFDDITLIIIKPKTSPT